MAVSDRLVSRIRVLAITHIVVGALMIIIGVADGVTGALSSDSTFIGGYLFFGVWIGTWICITGVLGIPGSTPQRTRSRNRFACVFMAFSITSAAFGGMMFVVFGITIGVAAHMKYDYQHSNRSSIYPRYPYGVKMGLAAVQLLLGIIEIITGVWVSICLCLMNPCCADSQEQTVAFPGSTPGNAVSQGGDGVPVVIPLQAPGVTVQTQPFYSYPQAGQTTIGDPVPFQAVGNQPHLVVVT